MNFPEVHSPINAHFISPDWWILLHDNAPYPRVLSVRIFLIIHHAFLIWPNTNAVCFQNEGF
jgi:hypothetical protein